LEALATYTGFTNSTVSSARYTFTVATPSLSPAAGTYNAAQTVTISDTSPGATIYYTLTAGTTGSAPSSSSTKYTAPISVSATSVLEAIGEESGYTNSAVSSARYTLKVATPAFSPVAGTYTTIQTVTISDTTPGATIYYTTSGSTPTTGSAIYSAPITVSATETLKAISAESGYTNSAVGSAVYTINLPTAATPTFSPAAGTYNAVQTVTISDATTGATIYYTTNGSTPTTGSAVYSTAISVSTSETLKAIAVAYNYLNSATGSAAYTLQTATPSFSPVAGTYTTIQSVTIADTTPGAVIYYTTNGSTPTTGSAIYSAPLTVSVTQTLKAIAAESGYTNSAVGSAAYTINLPTAATPTFSPVAGTYNTVQTVTISDATGGATIYYTTDGSTPTTGSAVYSTAISITTSETLKAIAVAYNYLNSATGSAAYTLQAAMPSFNPVAGTYASIQTVTISDSTAGATIYYTTNGSTPTTSSTQYSGAITVSANETLKAIATASGFNTSTTGSAAYTINLPTAATPTFNPVAGSYSSAQSVTISDTTTGATIYYTTNGNTPTTGSAVYSAAISVTANETIEAIAVAYNYLNSAVGSAAYTIAAATPTFSPAAGTYTTIQTVTIADTTPGAVIYYTTNGLTPTTSSTPYSGAITVSANETLETIATASGYGASATGSAAYTINLPTAATPTFNPVAGSYPSAQLVTISDTTTGATIYYTTNGSTPTTGSAVYSAAISVTANETIEAIAVAYNYLNSAVGSAAYTIAAATPTFSPAAGTYTTIQTVTISDTTAGAIIYYTTDGSTPTIGSAVYSVAITVSANETLEAIAASSGYGASATGSAAYTINLPTAATPAFSPVAGTYNGTQNVTIGDATTGATIYYTTDGSTPTTSSPVYSTPISVSTSETVQAIAVAYNYLNSAIGAAAYTITAVQGGQSSANFGSQAIGSPSTALSINFSIASGATVGSIAVQTLGDPNLDFANAAGTTCTVTTYSSATNCQVNVTFTPLAAGLRMGAVIFFSGAGNTGTVLASVPVYGVGTGPQIAYGPGTATAIDPTVNSEGLSAPNGLAVDGVGNLFIADTTNNRVVEVPVGGTATAIDPTVNSNGLSGPYGVAVDGAGDLFIADTSNNRVVEVPAGGGTATAVDPTVNSNGLSGPYGVAVDGAGDLFIADTSNNRVVEVPAGGGTPTAIDPTVNSNGLSSPYGVAVDGAGDLFITDCGNNRVVEMPAGGGTPTAIDPTVNGSGLSCPYGIAVDGAGNLFIGDKNNIRVVEVPASGGTPIAINPTVNGTGLNSPIGVAVDGAGDLFIADGGNNRVVELQRSQPPALSFPTATNVGSTDTTDGTQTVQVVNIGNQALIFTALSYPTDFPAASGDASACTGSSSLAAGQECDLPIEFAPQDAGSLNENVTLTDNALNVTGATQSIAVSGTGNAVPAATPTFSPVAGTYTMIQSVTIGDTTTGAVIYYTTDGSTPTTNSTQYSGAITVSASETMEAIATATNYLTSAVGLAAYTINLPTAATPSFSPAAGTYNSAQTVTINDSTPGATIYYTTDGSTPTTGSAVYAAPISVSTSETLQAFAVAYNYLNSATGSAAYTLQVATPVFSPPAGSYSTIQLVTISDITPGAVIYYTTDGSTPTTNSIAYVGPITIWGSATPSPLNAIAAAANFNISAAASATYSVPYVPAALQTPTPGTQLLGTSVTFTWTPGTGGTTVFPGDSHPLFELWVGNTGVGSSNLYNSGPTQTDSTNATGLPSNGEALYVRLYWLVNGAWQTADYTYSAYGSPTPATMSNPTAGSVLTGASQAFAWNPGNTATHFELWVGSTGVGSSDLYNSGNVTVTTETVNNLPTNGQPVYVRLYSLINGTWQSNDYTYTASGSPTPASMSSPTPGSTLTSTSQAFTWSPGNLATHFELWVGSTGVGSNNVYNSGNVTVTTETVNNLPTNGEPVYVRLLWLINGTWNSADYTYTASGSPTLATMSTPTPGTQLSGTSQAFTWNPGNVATHFELWVGSTGVGTSNVYNSGNVTVTTETVSGLPANGQPVYVRLYSLINGTWQSNDYTYTAYGSPTPAVLTTPTPGSQFTSATETFVWTPGNTATHFELWLGSTGVGSSNLYNSGNVTVTTETVSGLPINGEKVYARLYWLIDGTWYSADYTYMAQ